MKIREQADSGRPTVVADPDGEIAGIYKSVARQVAVKIALKAKDFSAKFPTITRAGAAGWAGQVSRCSRRSSSPCSSRAGTS
jgi:hypothetical protein